MLAGYLRYGFDVVGMCLGIAETLVLGYVCLRVSLFSVRLEDGFINFRQKGP